MRLRRVIQRVDSVNSNSKSSTPTPFYNLIGRYIFENYGRFKGRIISYKLNSKGELDKIFISNNGVILYKTSSSIYIENGKVKIVPPPIKKAYKLLDELQYIFLQVKTLNNILSIDSRYEHINKYYEIYRRRYEEFLDEISKVVKELESRRRYLNRVIGDYKEGIFTLQMEVESGRLEEDIYKICYNELSDEIIRLSTELEDVENLLSDISSLSDEIGEVLRNIYNRISGVEVYRYEEEEV